MRPRANHTITAYAHASYLVGLSSLVSSSLNSCAHIPRAAMLSAIAGVSLTFIALGFAVQIFAAPATAMVSMLLMLLFYGGQVKLPFRVPGGVIAVAAGWAIAVISGSLGYAWFSPASPEPTLPNTDGTGAIVPPPTIAFLTFN